MVAVLGSKLWDYLQKKLVLNYDKENKQNSEQHMYRDDLRERVRKLEGLLVTAGSEKDEMRKTIIELNSEVSALRVKVDFLCREVAKLEGENEKLRKANS